MGKRRQALRAGAHGTTWSQAQLRQSIYAKNMQMLRSLALNRFRWVGLPETVNTRWLEYCLLRFGVASLGFDASQPVPVLLATQAIPDGDVNLYNEPVKWDAVGADKQTRFTVDRGYNGYLGYYSVSRVDPWIAITTYAYQLTDIELTIASNLRQQHRPYVLVGPEEKKLEMQNLLLHLQDGEVAILGDAGLGRLVDNVKVIDLKVPLVAEDLHKAWMNTYYQALQLLGIPHLAFEKGERMIEQEARANTMPTSVMFSDCIDARRELCENINNLLGLSADVYFNVDLKSLNFNYINNVEAVAQDGGGESSGYARVGIDAGEHRLDI